MMMAMNRLLTILAVLALIAAGAGVCPSAHAAEAHGVAAGTPGHAMPGVHQTVEPCNGGGDVGAETEPQPADALGPCCDGGAACADCALLTVVLADPAAEPGAAPPVLLRAFTPATVPALTITFEPPPPKAVRV